MICIKSTRDPRRFPEGSHAFCQAREHIIECVSIEHVVEQVSKRVSQNVLPDWHSLNGRVNYQELRLASKQLQEVRRILPPRDEGSFRRGRRPSKRLVESVERGKSGTRCQKNGTDRRRLRIKLNTVEEYFLAELTGSPTTPG